MYTRQFSRVLLADEAPRRLSPFLFARLNGSSANRDVRTSGVAWRDARARCQIGVDSLVLGSVFFFVCAASAFLPYRAHFGPFLNFEPRRDVGQ